MKKISIIIILFSILFSFFVLTNANSEEKSSYSTNIEYELYKERVSTICDNKKYKTKKTLVNIEDNYYEIVNEWETNTSQNTRNYYNFEEIKNIHRENMNSIYKCSLLNVQKKALWLIKNDLESHPAILQKISWIINTKLNRIRLSISSLRCNDSNSTDSIQKLNVLKQATYQTCKYISYLEYLKEYNTKLETLSLDFQWEYNISRIIELEKERINEINEEKEHTYKVFPLAFHAYTEYENNISIHFLLELLKEDYIVVREKLHKVINPINQVVYKISNAMKK
jgi:hypothetical protein